MPSQANSGCQASLGVCVGVCVCVWPRSIMSLAHPAVQTMEMNNAMAILSLAQYAAQSEPVLVVVDLVQVARLICILMFVLVFVLIFVTGKLVLLASSSGTLNFVFLRRFLRGCVRRPVHSVPAPKVGRPRQWPVCYSTPYGKKIHVYKDCARIQDAVRAGKETQWDVCTFCFTKFLKESPVPADRRLNGEFVEATCSACTGGS